MDHTEQLPTVLSLCSGYGGIERGLELVGFKHRVVCYVEIEAFAAANLVAKMEEGELGPAPVWTNVKTLPVEIFRDRIDILVGGYPCQPFSTAGPRKGSQDPRHLWPSIKKIISSTRPIRCFFENVEGHITKGLKEVIGDLESLGYRATFGIFSASEVGASHQRKRVFIMADANSASSERKCLPGRIHEENSDTDSEGQLPYTHNSRGGKDQLLCESRTEGFVQPSFNTRCDRSSKVEQVQSWPAGPDQVQCDWEEPRTIESSMGRAVDGTATRLDRLRLLGNGVVPQTAALAWKVLSKRLEENG